MNVDKAKSLITEVINEMGVYHIFNIAIAKPKLQQALKELSENNELNNNTNL